MLNKVKLWWVKITQWEFWPFSIFYFPVFFFYTWLALRCRSFFFFTAANPSIDFGGMLGERKSEIFDLIPRKYSPRYALIKPGDITSAAKFAHEIGFPVIAKPDIGERGNLVEKIETPEALKTYLSHCPVPFLIQEFVSLPIELGVFFIKHPNEDVGKVTSMVQKDFLHVIGDGENSVKKLLQIQPRALFQLDFDHPRFHQVLGKIPKTGEKVIVEGIGNHCRGTTFLNAEAEIDDPLHAAFSDLASEIKGFHFGRFDLRCNSFDELRRLENFKILELNGAGAEPGHIYQPGFPLWKGYKSILWHLSQLAKVSWANHKLGVSYWSFRKGINKMRTIKAYNKIIQNL
ncbi:MAG: hypothetical protein RIC35_02965 [Marinoscillum sp.]